jgi:hypothetical protein
MLYRALVDEFQRYFAQAAHHDTVLWFDPDGEYAGLLDHLVSVPLWRYEGSLLRIRYRLNQRAPGERAVVYLPMTEEDADLLRPFFATSLCFKDRLYRFLRHQGLDFPDDPKAAHLMRELLPQLAIRSVGKGRQFWEYNLANLERAINTLLGEFDGTLLRFLDRPAEELASLCADQFDGLFFAQLAGAYGVQATASDEPGQVARELTAQLALVRAYEEAGRPADFPYSARLPQPHQFDRCARFLERWQNDARYAPTYVRLATEVGRAYNLDNWLEALPIEQALSLGPTLPDAETALWERVLRTLAGLESEPEWRDRLAAQRAALQERAQGFWVRQGQDPGWNVLVQAADLLTLAHEMRGELPRIARPAAMLQRYAGHWWRLDAAYRTFRQALASSPGGLDPVRDRCARAYGDALRAVNERFSTLLAAEGQWPPSDALPAQDRFWAEGVGPADKSQRIAVLFVDALRYELGQELLAQLEADRAGDTRALAARLAAIPTVTQLGMAALLPDGHQRRVTHDGEWHVKIRDSGDLAAKAARIEWLATCLPGRTTAAYNLNDLLSTPVDRIERADCTFVFDTTLDAVGENASELAWDAFEPLVRSVKQGVHKLLELGVETIHVVTDHGFLLLQEVAEHDKVTVRHVSATARKSRYLVGTQLGSTEQLEFPVPCSDGLEAWFPCGIGCFRTPGQYNYVHGGLSLQELVVPQLAVRQRQLGRPVGVRVELPDVIRQGQIKLTLEPIAETLVDQPRRVSLALEKGGEPVAPPFEATVLPTGPASLDVWLPQGCGLEMGDRVEWVLRDLLTGEVLKRQEAVSQVDLW